MIFNPAAARTHPRALEIPSSIFSGAGWGVEIVGTTHADEAAKLASEGVDAGVDVVAVNGGDGTIAQAIDGGGSTPQPGARGATVEVTEHAVVHRVLEFRQLSMAGVRDQRRHQLTPPTPDSARPAPR